MSLQNPTTEETAKPDTLSPSQQNFILLSNIGNSNLQYRHQEIPKNFFRTLTKQYLEDFPANEPDLQIQILQNHLAGVKHLYLFATDQEDEKHNYQDTYFAAEILKKLISKHYNIPVDVIRLKGNPTDENQVVDRYAPVIRKIIERHPEAHFAYNLAGGTSQMKTVMRELLIYHLPESRLSACYSDRLDQVQDVQRQYVERYILLKMAREFVQKYDYSAALEVLKQLPKGGKASQELRTALQIANLRQQFNLEEARKLKEEAKTLPAVFDQYLEGQADGLFTLSDAFQNAENRRKVFETASLSQLYFRQRKYAFGVMSFSRLMEEIGQGAAEEVLQTDVGIKAGQDKVLAEIQKLQIQEKYPKVGITRYGLPVLLLFGLHHPQVNEKLRPLFSLLIPMCSHVNDNFYKGINILRNQCFLAHDDKPVKADDLDKHVPGFLGQGKLQEVFLTLGLPETNIYDQMNQELEKMFLME